MANVPFDRVPLSNGDTGIVTDANAQKRLPKYGTCNTAGSTAAKVVTTLNGDYVLEAGNAVMVKFANKDTAGNITLAIDNTTAKPATLDSEPIAPSILSSDTVYEFVYNGTAYELVSGGGSGNVMFFDTFAEAAAASANGDIPEDTVVVVKEESILSIEYDPTDQSLIIPDYMMDYDQETETLTISI